MSAVRKRVAQSRFWWWMPVCLVEPGPYHRNDWRSRLRRLLEGWMPCVLRHHFTRVELAVRFRESLRTVPRVGLPLHPAWFSQTDMAWANEVAEKLDAELKAGER